MESVDAPAPLIATRDPANEERDQGTAAERVNAAGAPPTVLELDLDALLAASSKSQPAVADLSAQLPVFTWIAGRASEFFWVAKGTQTEIVKRVPEIRPQVRHATTPPARRSRASGVTVGLVATALVGAVAWGWVGGPASYRILELLGLNLSGDPAVNAVVERIISAESGGDANARNKRSSATGAGQFLNQTWLELIRAHRPDLARGSEAETLELRRDPTLAREITTRFAERNAALLAERCLPVTAGTLYLSHFAGGAGAVALLVAPEEEDAASVMAKADRSGRTTREKIVKANPFLEKFTVAEIRRWADRKMGGSGAGVVDLSRTKPALAFFGETRASTPAAEAIRCAQLGS